MKSKSRKSIALVIAIGSIGVMIALPAPAVEPVGPQTLPSSLDASHEASEFTILHDVYVDNGRENAPAACQFRTRGDRPHISMTRGYRDVSVHGWWENVNCSPGLVADVHVTLQALTQNGWYTVTTAEARLKDRLQGGGRTNARERCTDSRPYTYRAIIDVDLVGVIDDNIKAVVESNGTLACGFAWN